MKPWTRCVRCGAKVTLVKQPDDTVTIEAEDGGRRCPDGDAHAVRARRV